mgnify:CR=1 FL=1|jgi:hypothetical protein
MNNSISKKNNFLMFFGELNREHFQISPTWCEYYEPFELEEIKKEDVSMEWIENNIYNFR